MGFYKSTDYRKCIRWSLERLKSKGERLTFSQLAEAARVQPPYFSKVLSGTADLNEDQLHLVGRRLRLSEEELRFLQLLLQAARARLRERKEALLEEAEKIRNAKNSPAEQRLAERLPETREALAKYYLNPLPQIVHMSLTIPKWRKNPDSLRDRLGLAQDRWREILETLEQLKIIELTNGQIHLLKEHLHLPKTSPLCEPQQSILKIAGIERMRSQPPNRLFSFAATFSANEKAKDEIASSFAEFLRTVDSIVRAAPSEEVYQIHFDLFPWL